ncbi:MAG: zinc-ribbon domain-containing protein [Clostridiales bacterium]|nr:zinc-ribbon domain-containing protein [Clostridiales bacterium]
MAFLENIGKAAQAAAKKSGELVEVTKLNVNVGSEEDKIQKLYTQIGKIMFEKYTATGVIENEAREACEQIKVHEAAIKTLKDKIAEIKSVKSCINCGTEMERSQVFCAKCGARNEVPSAGGAPEAAQETIFCPSCGASLPAGSQFCTGCGSKI